MPLSSILYTIAALFIFVGFVFFIIYFFKITKVSQDRQAEEMNLKAKIEEYSNKTGMDTQSDSQQQSIPEQIKAFKELYEDGILTEEEFEKKKKELLNM